MALKITVRKNCLPACSSPFIVHSETSAVIDYDRFVDLMSRGRTTLSKVDILAAMQLYKEELQKQLALGNTVKTPTGSFYLSAGGCMDYLDEAFQPEDQANNHEIRLHHKPEKGFEEAVLSELEVEREEKPDLSRPSVRAVRSAGEDKPKAIRSGGMVQVTGLRLRFDPKDSKQGVFFIAEAGAETRSPFYPMLNPGLVLASVPAALAAGSYTVTVRAAVNGKDIREGSYGGVTIAS
jgi:hypothetical protein